MQEYFSNFTLCVLFFATADSDSIDQKYGS